VGLNVFVIANVVGEKVPLERIFSGILRFLTVDVLVLILIMAVPALSLALPGTMR
jgi:TRAP-type C4-dicarboxylate transport system permease large subunit